MNQNRWTCGICRDGVAHLHHHLSRHLNSQRHKQTVKHLNQDSLHPLPPPTDQEVDLNDVIDDIGAPQPIDDLPTEVSNALFVRSSVDGLHRVKRLGPSDLRTWVMLCYLMRPMMTWRILGPCGNVTLLLYLRNAQYLMILQGFDI